MKKNESESCKHVTSEFSSSGSESDELYRHIDDSTDTLIAPSDTIKDEEEGVIEQPVQPKDVYNFPLDLESGAFHKIDILTQTFFF